jgi:hypothetical protein
MSDLAIRNLLAAWDEYFANPSVGDDANASAKEIVDEFRQAFEAMTAAASPADGDTDGGAMVPDAGLVEALVAETQWLRKRRIPIEDWPGHLAKVVAAREAAARCDEAEQIAQAIEAMQPPSWSWLREEPVAVDGYHGARTSAARIARARRDDTDNRETTL